MKHPDFKTAQTTFEFLLGPVKIKDGLFMGDELAAKVINNRYARISILSSAIKSRISSTPFQKQFPICTKDLAYNIYQCIGPKTSKMYDCD